MFAAALAAYREGRIGVPPRATTVRDATEYDQDLSSAEAIFPDEPERPRRGRYR